MAQSAPPPKKTYEEYLALEAASEEKHEFLDGEIRAMAGGTIDHLVSQKDRRIDVFRRKDDGHWDFFDVGPGETLELTSIEASVSVDAVYADPLAPVDEPAP